MKTRIEKTNRCYGMLVQGGICGRVVEYDAALVAEIMECDIAAAAAMDGSETVPHCEERLANYLEDCHSDAGKVVKKGTVIQ